MEPSNRTGVLPFAGFRQAVVVPEQSRQTAFTIHLASQNQGSTEDMWQLKPFDTQHVLLSSSFTSYTIALSSELVAAEVGPACHLQTVQT